MLGRRVGYTALCLKHSSCRPHVPCNLQPIVNLHDQQVLKPSGEEPVKSLDRRETGETSSLVLGL